MEFPGCSNVKPFPDSAIFQHSSAARSAMIVSSRRRFNPFCESLANSSGIPSGCCSSLKGLGGFLTPGIGISRALEKVAQFGAK